MSVGKRLGELYEAIKIADIVKNKQDFCEKLGIDYKTFSRYLRDEINFSINSENCDKFFMFNVNINWLLAGQGEMFMNTAKDARNIDMHDGEIYIQREQKIVNQEYICEGTNIVMIEVLNQKVSAGPGQELVDCHVGQMIPMIADIIYPYKANEISAVCVRGDSMTKITLFDGDIVLFVKGLISGDGIYVITVGSESFVKRLEFDIFENKISIISENDRYPERKVVPADSDLVKIEGKVKAWVHKHPY